jgi:hypothetical protein
MSRGAGILKSISRNLNAANRSARGVSDSAVDDGERWYGLAAEVAAAGTDTECQAKQEGGPTQKGHQMSSHIFPSHGMHR